MRISENLRRLDDFLAYKEGWNGNGVRVISFNTVQKAKEMVEGIGKKFEMDVYPLADGGVQVEYDLENAGYLEFYVHEGKENVDVFIIDRENNQYDFSMQYDIPKMISLTDVFNRGRRIPVENYRCFA